MISLPIILIHGFNGAPSNWTGPEDRFPEFLAAQGYDPALIRVFDYGSYEYEGKLRYNNLGDIREIAHRLDEADSPDPVVRSAAVDALSRDSIARGGPSKVTIIAHSSGGIVARYYLTRQVDDWLGTRYRGNVERVIFLGTPHHGVDVEDILDPLPSNLLLYRLMIRLHYLFPPEYHEQAQSLNERFAELRRMTKQTFLPEQAYAETPAFRQLHPGSELLDDINHPGAMPQDIEYFNIIGDIRAGVRIQWLNRELLDQEKSFGDMLVTTESSGSIPNASSQCFPIKQEHWLQVDIGRRISRLIQLTDEGEHPIPIHRWLRSLPASREHMLSILAKAKPTLPPARIPAATRARA